MIKGYATSEGTEEFTKKQKDLNNENFRKIHGLSLSNVGVGTYLGNPDEPTDELVKNAVKASIIAGINVIDIIHKVNQGIEVPKVPSAFSKNN